MIVYIIRRLMQAALVMVVMSVLVFVGIYLIGDPVVMMISPDAIGTRARGGAPRAAPRPADVAAVPAVRERRLHGNFGKSFLAGQPAMGLIFERMPATLELAFASLILSLAIGLPLGVYAGLRPHAPGSQGDHDRLDPGLLAAQFLGRADADHGVRRDAARPVPGWPRLPASGRGATVDVLGVNSRS